MELKERARRRILADAPTLLGLSHRLHAHPELAYEEIQSARLLADALEAGGMRVERGAHGLDSAFSASAGRSGTNLVLCAEYDALPEIGHACGHNIIAASSVGAGLALGEVAEDLGVRVTVLGTPAEESGGGKIDLLRAGAFEDAAVAMMVHPAPYEVTEMSSLAWARLDVAYHGREAHASATPYLGRNALDAVNLAYMAIGALRQHIRPTERLHGIITHGGDAPNVVPKLSRARFFIRARDLERLEPLKERAVRCFEAGALATGCELELTWLGNEYDRLRTNETLASLYQANLEALGRHALPPEALSDQPASTDMGNVSQVVPSIHPLMSIDSLPAVNHQAEFTAHTVSPAGDRAVVDAALALAWTALDLALSPETLDRVTDEFTSARPTPHSVD